MYDIAVLRRSQSQHFLFLFALIPLILAVVAYRTSSTHVASVAATLSTDKFIRNLDELLSTVQDAETGQRGYLLTGQQGYLLPFLQAENGIEAKLHEVEREARRSGVSQAEIARLRDAISAKMAELQRTVQLRQSSGLSGALPEVKTNRGQILMAQIRSVLSSLKNEQTATFRQRLDDQRSGQRLLNIVLAGGVGLGFILLFLSFRFNRRYIQERDRTESEIRHLNETLEIRVRDRTLELQARTEELENRTAELQRSNADLAQFAYIASHDLQEPLRMVGSYVGLLARRYEGKLDASADKYIAFAVDGANRMQALIQDLLAYARAGTQALQKRPVPSQDVLSKALKNLEITIRDSSASVHHGLLPIVEADEMKLTQVMQNLIANAIKFAKPDSHPEIGITARKGPSEWLFSVSDKGIGFDPKYSERIFQVFQRLHGPGQYSGNGIGLAICRRIIEHHGGRMWAESEPGIGSNFFFTLPVSRPRENRGSRRQKGELESVQGTAG